ncbi:hypothetical protein J6590_081528 [Homalodisca vitripennis]|nr:hypothetical protein J6590_081528 [Homalodisca vitripennis]
MSQTKILSMIGYGWDGVYLVWCMQQPRMNKEGHCVHTAPRDEDVEVQTFLALKVEKRKQLSDLLQAGFRGRRHIGDVWQLLRTDRRQSVR